MATIKSHAERIFAAQDPEWLEEAAADIAETMRSRWGLLVQESRSFRARGAGGWCDGMSITEAGVVVYRRTGGRRFRFTLAHELAHMLVESDDDCLMWLADRNEVDRDLEQICDVIAAKVLIPDWAVDRALAGGYPSANTLTALHQSTTASWSACAIALAGRLPCDGFVVIANRTTNTVYFSSRARDTHPYAWAGDTIPTSHELRRETPPATCKTWWPRFSKNDPRPYYASIEVSGDFVQAVFVENDLWSVDALHLPSDDQADRRYQGTIDCPSCGYKGRTAFFPCSTCKKPTCQKCHKCGCDRVNELQREMCQYCTRFFPLNQLEDGYCSDCR
jgi:hypothetical protein